MLVMRKVEERVGHLYIQQKFGDFVTYIGQEAIVVAQFLLVKKMTNTSQHIEIMPTQLG